MHGHDWGRYPTRHYRRAGMEVDIPLVPAPMAAATMVVGLLLGVMIGYKKAAMLHAHRRMLGYAGHGWSGLHQPTGVETRGVYQEAGDTCCVGSARMMHKKAMIRAMVGHHHHGSGAPCCCAAGPVEDSQNESEGEERTHE